MENKKNPILSIIVPVYNLQDYIESCLDSIYCQQVDDNLFEVVAVDDGSQDDSMSILQQYATRQQNLRVLHQQNGGVSRTRNYAIRESAGRYLTFVDGDDSLYENSLAQILDELMTDKEFDVMYCRTYWEMPDSTEKECKVWTKQFRTDKTYTGTQLLDRAYTHGGVVWGGVYSKSLIDKYSLSFAEDVANGEDSIFNLILLAHNPTIIFRDINLNKIAVREGSATHSPSLERVLRFSNNVKYLHSYRKLHPAMDKYLRQSIDMGMYGAVMSATNMYIKSGGTDWHVPYEILDIKHLWRLRVRWLPMHQQIKIHLINVSYWLYYKMVKTGYD